MQFSIYDPAASQYVVQVPLNSCILKTNAVTIYDPTASHYVVKVPLNSCILGIMFLKFHIDNSNLAA